MKMRKFFAFTAAAAIFAALGFSAEASEAAEPPLAGEKKALIVYFSKTGNTQGVAETVAKLTGAEIFRLETVEPYPDDYHTSTEVAKRQLEENARPALKAVPQNLAQLRRDIPRTPRLVAHHSDARHDLPRRGKARG